MSCRWSGDIYVTEVCVSGPKMSQREPTWHFTRRQTAGIILWESLICGFGSIRSEDTRPAHGDLQPAKAVFPVQRYSVNWFTGQGIGLGRPLGLRIVAIFTQRYGVYRVMGRQTERQTDRERQAERQAERQTDRQRDRQRDRQEEQLWPPHQELQVFRTVLSFCLVTTYYQSYVI